MMSASCLRFLFLQEGRQFVFLLKAALQNFSICYILFDGVLQERTDKRMVLIMTILENWRNLAYGEGLDDKEKEELWTQYFKVEKGIYEHILTKPEEVVEGTVEELAKRYGTDVQTMTGFLDGINESLKGYENPVETMDENTVVKIEIDQEKLYYNMVEAKAEWLYSLPQWDQILTEEKKKELYKTQKASGTIVKGAKIGRNDPCPCGSGKKYKKCCGQNL